MQILTTIVLLVQDFSRIELKNAEKLLKKHGSRGRLLQLYNLISKKKVVQYNDLIISLYNEDNIKTQDSFRKLCDRFLGVVFEVIVQQEIFDIDREAYSDPFYYRKLMFKKMELLHVLTNKFISKDWMLRYIESIEAMARKFEFLEELQVILKFKIAFCADSEFFKKYEKALKDYNVNLRNCELGNLSDYYLTKYIGFVQNSSIDDKSKVNEMEEVLQKMSKDYNETGLSFILFRKLMIELQLLHFKENFEEAEKVILEIIRVTENEYPLMTFSRISQNYMNLAFTQFYLYKFIEAYESSLKASRKAIIGLHFRNSSWESAVFALIYLKRPEEASEKLAEILESELIGNTPVQFAKRNLMMAFVKYLQKDYKAAFKYLQKTKEIESDKEGWNLGIRMLNIYLTLSTDKIDLADQRINSMRKHIERTTKLRNLRKRDVVIFRVLSHLSRSGFDFKETWEDRQKDFQLLRSDLPDYKWVPRSHELIIFDQWFESKMNGVEYDPVFPSPKQNATVEKN